MRKPGCNVRFDNANRTKRKANGMNTMIQQWLQGRKTYLTCLTVGVLLFGSWQKWWQLPPEIYAGLAALATAFLRAGIAKAQGSQGDPEAGGAQVQSAECGVQSAGCGVRTQAAASAPETKGGTKGPGALGLTAGTFIAGAALGAGLLAAGCATELAPGGAYSGDPFLYWADSTVGATSSALDAFESWELQNYIYLETNSPAVVAAAEVIRTNAPVYYQDYVTARAAYLSLLNSATSNQLLAVIINYTNLQSGAVTNAIP